MCVPAAEQPVAARKRFSVLFFLAGSVLCGVVGSMTLVASRAPQGIGGGAG